MVYYGSTSYNRFHVSTDRLTPWQRTTGKKHHRPVCDFSEKLLFICPGSKPKKWKFGVWLGLRPKSCEIIVGSKGGVFYAHTVRRLMRTDQWDLALVESITMSFGGHRTHQHEHAQRLVIPANIPDMQPTAGQEDFIFKDVYIKRSDIMKYGYTVGCGGCNALRLRKRPQRHTAACRQRIWIN